MKPNPLSSLNHFTVPVAMLALLGWRAAHSEDALGQRHGALALHSPDPVGPAVLVEQYLLTSANGCRPDKGGTPGSARERRVALVGEHVRRHRHAVREVVHRRDLGDVPRLL